MHEVSMLMFALTCLRSDHHDEPMRLILSGRFQDGVQLARARLEHKPTALQVHNHAVLGQVVGRVLLRMGRAGDAEECFRRQLRTYEMGSRSYLRSMSSLDQGELHALMNKPSRAALAYAAVADDDTAPTALRIEALCGVATSLRTVGEYRRARHALQFARSLADQEGSDLTRHLIDGMLLETEVIQQLCVFDEGADHASHAAATKSVLPLHDRLLACAASVISLPFAAQRLRFLAALIDRRGSAMGQAEQQLEHIHDLHRCKLVEQERESRVEAALAQLAAGDCHALQALLGSLAHDEEAIRKQRHSLELRYCLSRIYAMQGRHADALRVYKDHVAQTLARLHTELSQLPYLRCLEQRERLEQSDPAKLLLPLRYRRAYQYIMENLNNRDLSVREVAAHIDVTERAMQMAFRTHLGLSPAELIRRRRVENIRKDLLGSQERSTVIDVAQRWGFSARSTLTHNYRQLFKETPSAMLRGAATPPLEPLEIS